ncbi:MAG: type I restriction-modification system subunit M, partial [Wenzhouxiangellaceae bacterium]
MITGEIKSKVDRIWDTMWAGGISNPLSVVEQLTYLLFIKRLDEIERLEENKARRTGRYARTRIFGQDQQHLRWSHFRDKAPEQLFEIVRDQVFPFMKSLGEQVGEETQGGSTYSHHMKDALFMMPTPRVLANVVDQLDEIDMADRDTKGDLYEYMLGKIASAGQNGQFRTPRHIIKLMVEMTAPTPADVICDPACGSAGYLVAAAEYLHEHHGDEIYRTGKSRRRYNEATFHGFDFDTTMLRIGSMNMLLHGVENPDIRYKDSLAESPEDDAARYTLILANPPFAGSLDFETTARDLQQIVKTKKTELLFLALFLRLLKTGGRAAVIVPDGVLFGSSKAHKTIRRILVEDQKLDAVISMPSGVFKPYAGVSTAVLLFTKTNSGGTDNVWFYDMRADGYTLDDKRTPQPDKTDLPDILKRWQNL